MLNEKQKLAYDLIKQGYNVFVSGPGGVGKSYLLNKILEDDNNETIVMAPTGIAALNVNGATIHSTFKLPISVQKIGSPVKSEVKILFQDDQIKRIIIDEISMVTADVFIKLDRDLRRVKRNKLPFGGIQIIVMGDFFQLSPVLTETDFKYYNDMYKSLYAFATDSWKEAGFVTIELENVLRQTDEEFIHNLMNIRKGENVASSLAYMMYYTRENEISADALTLCSYNSTANQINYEHISALHTKPRTYYAKKQGDFKAEPAPQTLILKEGAKVMLLANTDMFCNGHVGYVDKMEDSYIYVKLTNGELVKVEKMKWNMKEYKKDYDGIISLQSVGSYEQFPIKLGWANSMHKSQGQSLDEAYIDVGIGCFAPGQLYVGLSRLRSIGGMYIITKLSSHDVIVSEEVKRFYDINKSSNVLNHLG